MPRTLSTVSFSHQPFNTVKKYVRLNNRNHIRTMAQNTHASSKNCCSPVTIVFHRNILLIPDNQNAHHVSDSQLIASWKKNIYNDNVPTMK